MSQKTLIIGAWWPEIRALVGVLGGEELSETLKAPFPLSQNERIWIRAQKSAAHLLTKNFSLSSVLGNSLLLFENHNVALTVTGIGGYRASAVIASILTLSPEISHVVFCGTAGSYSPTVHINSVFCSTDVTFTEAGLVDDRSYLPGEKGFHRLTSETKSPFASLLPNRTVCPPSITTDENLADRFQKFGEVENLELYGVALAAKSFGKTWEAIMGISNFVGKDAHEEWKTHHETASLAAQSELLRVVSLSFF